MLRNQKKIEVLQCDKKKLTNKKFTSKPKRIIEDQIMKFKLDEWNLQKLDKRTCDRFIVLIVEKTTEITGRCRQTHNLPTVVEQVPIDQRTRTTRLPEQRTRTIDQRTRTTASAK